MKTRSIIFLSTGGLILLFVIGINLLGTRSDIVSGITGDKIKQVKPGWTLEQVVATLGRPYKIGASQGIHKIDCTNPKPRLEMDVNNVTDIRQIVDDFFNDTNYCCEANKKDLQTKGVSLTYTRPVKLSKHYPMLWVHLDSSFKVYNVYAKQYDGILGFDDPGIYSISWASDTSTMTMKNGMESSINEAKFKDCFK